MFGRYFVGKTFRLITLLSLLIVSSAFISTIPLAASTEISSLSLDKTQIFALIEQTYAVLEDQVFYDSVGLMGWELSSKSTDSEVYGTGYEIGLAGIADYLLDLFELGVEVSISFLEDILNSLKLRSFNSSSLISWPRFFNITVGDWTGHRYGSAGILPVLQRFGEMGIGNVSHYVNQGFDWLMSMNEFGGNYFMGPGGYTTTDIAYGSSGIGISLLQLYDMTTDSRYLNISMLIGDWLLDISQSRGSGMLIPWSVSEGGESFDSDYYTGYLSGLAGTLDFFIQLYGHTGMESYFQAIAELSRFLLDLEENGSWGDAGSHYLLVKGNDAELIGYGHGATGIASVLFSAFDITLNENILDTVGRVELYLSELIEEDGTLWLSSHYQDQFAYNGLYHGSAGAALFDLEIYERFGLEENLVRVNCIIQNLEGQMDNYGKIPARANNVDDGFAYNIENGLAGIGKMLIKAYNTNLTLETNVSNPFDETGRFFIDPVARNIIIATILILSTVLVRRFRK